MSLARTPPASPSSLTPSVAGGSARNTMLSFTKAVIDSQLHHSESEPDLHSLAINKNKKRKHDEEETDVMSLIKDMFASFSKEQEIRFQELKSSMDLMSNKYDEFLTKINALELERKSDKALIKDLEEKLEAVERKSRSTGVEIRNIPKHSMETKETLCQEIIQLGKMIDVSIDHSTIKDVYRLKSKDESNPVIVDLTTVMLKDKVLKAVKSFNKTKTKGNKLNTTHLNPNYQAKPLYISETLTSKAQKVINARTLMNQNKIRSITQKILLQMNCKLGGTLWNINIPFKSAMVIGIDSHHDASRKKQSVCAFVASYNQSMTHWYSRVVFQSKGQEIVDSLKDCLVDSLKHYIKVNSQLPERIIIYRDGVGDGEFKVLQNYEIPQMEISLSLFEGEYKPLITYIVVQKRINTRIFMKCGNSLENPNPGTIVDHGVTRRDWYDFLIVSQKVNQGTVTPTHYVVIHDTSDMTPDQCQRITYKLCHLYYNWPGTVRVPAPCQYAHKLAYLVGNSIHQHPASVLQDKLFFL
uniref:Piwi domain-containing protein n=1 Tax=Heliothis virescens TaxID=7102 RepID=A0A2A4IUY8_HELVI